MFHHQKVVINQQTDFRFRIYGLVPGAFKVAPYSYRTVKYRSELEISE